MLSLEGLCEDVVMINVRVPVADGNMPCTKEVCVVLA